MDVKLEAIQRILEKAKNFALPPAAGWIMEALGEVEQLLRVNHDSAIISYRQGFTTESGQMYSFVLTNADQSFEQILFRAYVPLSHTSSASLDLYEGDVKQLHGREEIREAVLEFMSRESLVLQLDGLLSQFERIAERGRA
jgi:hypothetical protein